MIFPIVRLYVQLAILLKQLEKERIENIKFSFTRNVIGKINPIGFQSIDMFNFYCYIYLLLLYEYNNLICNKCYVLVRNN